MNFFNIKTTSIQSDWVLPVSIDCDRDFDKRSFGLIIEIEARRSTRQFNTQRVLYFPTGQSILYETRYSLLRHRAGHLAHTFIPTLFPSSGLSVQMQPSQHHIHY